MVCLVAQVLGIGFATDERASEIKAELDLRSSDYMSEEERTARLLRQKLKDLATVKRSIEAMIDSLSHDFIHEIKSCVHLWATFFCHSEALVFICLSLPPSIPFSVFLSLNSLFLLLSQISRATSNSSKYIVFGAKPCGRRRKVLH